MTISAVIPTYNSARTIRETIESVLCQRCRADELIVIDDGSTDGTVEIVRQFGNRVRLIVQANGGVAAARNVLVEQAEGELIAFLDHDDIWHPDYLLSVRKLVCDYQEAVAYFTGHVNFGGYEGYYWPETDASEVGETRILSSIDFFREYNENTGLFGSMSYCCVPKRVLTAFGREPFAVDLCGVDDSYLCTWLPLLGRPVVFNSSKLVAYRICAGAQSVNRLRSYGLWVKVFEQLHCRYLGAGQRELMNLFSRALASRRRQYAKMLMSAGRAGEARRQFLQSFRDCSEVSSQGKSGLLLASTFLPSGLQPQWPCVARAS